MDGKHFVPTEILIDVRVRLIDVRNTFAVIFCKLMSCNKSEFKIMEHSNLRKFIFGFNVVIKFVT